MWKNRPSSIEEVIGLVLDHKAFVTAWKNTRIVDGKLHVDELSIMVLSGQDQEETVVLKNVVVDSLDLLQKLSRSNLTDLHV